MVTLTRMEVLKIIYALEDSITEYEQTAARSSSEYAEKCAARSDDLWRLKMKLREVLDYDSKRIAVE